MTGTERSEYTRGLRLLADLLDEHPAIPLPYEASVQGFVWGDDAPARFAAAVASADLGWAEVLGDDDQFYSVTGHLSANLRFRLTGRRSVLCQPVVIGTRTETHDVVSWRTPLSALTADPEQATA